METKSLQEGTYHIFDAFYELHNGKRTPVATAIFKQPHWSRFDFKLRKVRIGSLFNKNSTGPKEEFMDIETLILMNINVTMLEDRQDPLNPNRRQYLAEWSVDKPYGYDEIKAEQQAIEGDFLLQEEAILSNLRVIEQEVLIDDFIFAESYQSSVIVFGD